MFLGKNRVFSTAKGFIKDFPVDFGLEFVGKAETNFAESWRSVFVKQSQSITAKTGPKPLQDPSRL